MVRASDLWLVMWLRRYKFDSRFYTSMQWPWTSCSRTHTHTRALLTKQYNLVPAKGRWCSMTEKPTVGWSGIELASQTHWYAHLRAEWPKSGRWTPSLCCWEVKEVHVDFYSAPFWETRLWSAQVWITHCYTANSPYPPVAHKRLPDGATSRDSSHLIAAYYSFIDPWRMKGWVGLVSWPTAGSLPM